MKYFLKLFLPQHMLVSIAEKLRSGLAGGVAILWLGLLIEFLPHEPYALLMLGSIAASAVLLFAVPHSPLAQPWNLVIGHGVSAVLGWTVSWLMGDPVIAAAVAVGASILCMHLLDALHPPGAATALTLVLGASQFHHMGGLWTAAIVAVNVGSFLIFALIINNLLPGRSYPMPLKPQTPPPSYVPLGELTLSDIEFALQEIDSVIDANNEELLAITRRAVEHAYQREEAK